MVPKRGEGGTLTGGVSGSSGVMVLLAGSKNWTLVGVEGAIMTVQVVRGESGELEEVVVVVVADGQGTEGMLKNPGLRDGGLYIRTSQWDKWI